MKMLLLIIHLYGHYDRILATDLEANKHNLREAFNPDNSLESLYTRLKKCVDYTTAAGYPITEVQVVRITYSLVAETVEFQEYWWNWRAKSDLENTSTKLQAHFVEAKTDLLKWQQTYRQGGYSRAGIANNTMDISTTFANLTQATADYVSAVTNMTMANSTLTEQVTLYTNRLSTKDVDNVVLQTLMKNLQGEVNKLKAKVVTLKRAGHSDTTGAANKDRGRPEPKWKREVKTHYPTWCNTP